MKKKICLLYIAPSNNIIIFQVLILFCIFCNSFSFSQSSLSANNDSIRKYQNKGFQIGIVLSPQITSLKNKDDRNAEKELDYVPTLNFSYGLILKKSIYKSLGILSGCIISNEGQKYKGNIEYWVPSDIIGDTTQFYFNDNYTARVKLRYIQLPVMIYWSPMLNKSFSLFNASGIQWSFLKKAGVFTTGFTGPGRIQNYPNAEDYYNTSGTSAVFILGVEYYYKERTAFSFFMTSTYGLFDIENKSIIERDPSWRFPVGNIVHPGYYQDPNYFPDASYSKRPATASITYGISFTIAYNLIKPK